MLVLGQDAGRRLHDQQDRVGPLHGFDAAQEAEPLQPVTGGGSAADAGRVDQHHRQAVEAEHRVHRVPGRSGDVADQGALVAEQLVEQRGLPDVGAAHDREPGDALLVRALDRRLGKGLEQAVEKVVDPDAMLGGDEQHLLEAELEDLVPEVLLARDVGLVGGHDHGPPGAPQELGDVAVDRGQALADVEQEDDRARLFDRDPGLGFDVGLAELPLGRPAVQLQPGRVDDRELMAKPLADAVEAVAGKARGGVDDRLPPADQAVEERGLANVGPADDGDDWAGHG